MAKLDRYNYALEALKVELENLPKKMPDMNVAVRNLNYLEGRRAKYNNKNQEE